MKTFRYISRALLFNLISASWVKWFDPTALPDFFSLTKSQTAAVRKCSSVSVHPEVQKGAPVFSGTRVRVETFYDYIRLGVSLSEFLDEFPSITRDQVLEVYDLYRKRYTIEQIAAMATGPGTARHKGDGR